MAKRSKRREASSPDRVEPDSAPLTDNPFAALAGLAVPEAPVDDAPRPAEAEAVSAVDPTRPGLFGPKVIVRREKKGRGGKTVTIVEGLRGSASDREQLLRELKRSLGCGGQAEHGNLILSGTDHGRVAAWLEARGAARVVLGN